MLAGEYSILYSRNSLATAVDKYVHLDFSPNASGSILIDSQLWSGPQELDFLKTEYPDNPVVETALWALGTWQANALVKNSKRLSD